MRRLTIVGRPVAQGRPDSCFAIEKIFSSNNIDVQAVGGRRARQGA
jgi:hypothetical protein